MALYDISGSYYIRKRSIDYTVVIIVLYMYSQKKGPIAGAFLVPLLTRLALRNHRFGGATSGHIHHLVSAVQHGYLLR